MERMRMYEHVEQPSAGIAILCARDRIGNRIQKRYNEWETPSNEYPIRFGICASESIHQLCKGQSEIFIARNIKRSSGSFLSSEFVYQKVKLPKNEVESSRGSWGRTWGRVGIFIVVFSINTEKNKRTKQFTILHWMKFWSSDWAKKAINFLVSGCSVMQRKPNGNLYICIFMNVRVGVWTVHSQSLKDVYLGSENSKFKH